MNKVGIFGIGAIGSVLAKYLTRHADNECFFYNRTEHKFTKVKFKEKETVIQLDINANAQGNLDWLIICIKENHFEKAKDDIRKLISEETKLAIFQNGIDISRPYLELGSKSPVLETIIDCPTERLTKTCFKQIRLPKIVTPKNHLANEFIKLFDDKEISFSQSTEFKNEQWIKLIESSALGTIQSHTGMPCSVFKETKYLDDFKSLIKEGIEVAKSESIKLSPELSKQLLLKLENYPASKGSSMLSDKLSGNVLELEAKIGAIVRVAERNKIRVPVSRRYYQSLLEHNMTISS